MLLLYECKLTWTSFKDTITFRQTAKIGFFLNRLLTSGVENMSFEHCASGHNPFEPSPKPTTKMWEGALRLYLSKKYNTPYKIRERQYILYGCSKAELKEYLKLCAANVSSSLDYKKFTATASITICQVLDEGKFICTCKKFVKKRVCQHELHAKKLLGLLEFPAKVRQVPIGQKPPRGRPPKALYWQLAANAPMPPCDLTCLESDEDSDIDLPVLPASLALPLRAASPTESEFDENDYQPETVVIKCYCNINDRMFFSLALMCTSNLKKQNLLVR